MSVEMMMIVLLTFTRAGLLNMTVFFSGIAPRT